MPVLNRVAGSATTLSNTAAETTMYTYSVPATMGAISGHVLELELLLTLLNNSGANRTYTLRVKFGGTTQIADALIAIPTSAALRSMVIRVVIQNDSTTSAQFIAATVSVSAPLAVTSGVAGDFGTAPTIPPTTIMANGTINQLNAATLEVSLQSDAATATQTITTRTALLELK